MIDANLAAALRGDVLRLHTFVEMKLDSGTARLWDGYGTSPELNGATYIGVGSLGRVDYGEDSLSQLARPFSLILSGSYEDKNGNSVAVDGFADVIGRALTSTTMQGRICTVMQALMDENASAILYTTITMASGRIDKVDVSENEQGFKSLKISLEDKTLLLNKANPRKMSQESHREITANSTFMAQTVNLKTNPVVWGRRP